jgi:hypothetical protein
VSAGLNVETCEPRAPMCKDRRKWISERERERENLPFPCLFILFGPAVISVMATHIGEDNVPTLPIQILISSRKKPDRHTQK